MVSASDTPELNSWHLKVGTVDFKKNSSWRFAVSGNKSGKTICKYPVSDIHADPKIQLHWTVGV